jgi:hypothetical protein
MVIQLEFEDSNGSESIAPPIERYDGPVPSTGDTVYLIDMMERYRVVRRIFYFFPHGPLDMKVSLHCEPLPEGRFY